MFTNKQQGNKRRRAFTLVELIVVTSIFGLLSSVVLVSAASSRVQAQDKITLASFDTFRTSLETYYNQHGSYPNPCYAAGTCGNGNVYCVGATNCVLLGKLVSAPLTLAPSTNRFAVAPAKGLDIAALLLPIAHASTFPAITTPTISTTATVDGVNVTGNTKGFVYMPCDSNTPGCFEGTAEVTAPTYQYGIVSQTVGLWENINLGQLVQTTGATILNNGASGANNPSGPASGPSFNGPGSSPGSFFPNPPY